MKDGGYRFRQKDENLGILVRNCEEKATKVVKALEEFCRIPVDLIYCIGSPAAALSKAHIKGKDIPVVCTACFDPVVLGLANGYESSGNNITGTCYRISVIDQIQSGLLGLVPELKTLGVVYHSGELQSEIQLDESQMACKKLGIELVSFDVHSDKDFSRAADFFKSREVEAVFLVSDTCSASASEDVLKEITGKFPTLCGLISVIRKGGLVGRIADWDAIGQQAADMVLKILHGSKASEIPIRKNPQARTVLNMDTLNALNLKPSKKFLSRIDERIRKSTKTSAKQRKS
ncbi:ABC transporter substrate-binding protein [Candidatus Riflebacteria bacterium]